MHYKLTYITAEQSEFDKIPGKVITQFDWQALEPSYKMKLRRKIGNFDNKQNNLYYKSVILDLLPKQARTLHKRLEKSNQILRYLLVKLVAGENRIQDYNESEKTENRKTKKMKIEELGKKLDEILSES